MFVCKKCGFTTNRAKDYERHLNRIRPCSKKKVSNPKRRVAVRKGGAYDDPSYVKDDETADEKKERKQLDRMNISNEEIQFWHSVENSDKPDHMNNVRKRIENKSEGFPNGLTQYQVSLKAMSITASAVEYGQLGLVKYLHTIKYSEWNTDTFKECVRGGVNVRHPTHTGPEDPGGNRIPHFNLAILKYLHKNGCPSPIDICAIAVTSGNVDALKFLIQFPDKYPLESYPTAGNLILGTYEMPGCVLAVYDYNYGHGNVANMLKILTILFDKGYPYDKDDIFSIAIERNNLPLLKFLIDRFIVDIDKEYVIRLMEEWKDEEWKMDKDYGGWNKGEDTYQYLEDIRDNMSNTIRRIKPIGKSSSCDENENCSICLDELKVDTKGGHGQLTCGHCFHVNCLFKWYEKNIDGTKNTSCPVCRKVFIIEKKNDGYETLRGGVTRKKVPKAYRRKYISQ